MDKPRKVYLIKALAPWMMEEVISFSKFTSFEIIFFREVSDFYKEDLKILKENGIKYYIKPFKKVFNLKDFFIVLTSIITKPKVLFGKYNLFWTLQGARWFLKLDKSLIQNVYSTHAQFASQAGIVAWYLKKAYKIDYHFTFHAHDIYFKNNWFSRLVKDSKSSFSISTFNINYVCSCFGVEKGKIVLSRLGVRLPEIKTKLQNEKFVLGFISNLEPKKGIPYLMEAFNKLQQKNNGKYELWIAGSGEEMPFIENFIQENQLVDSVKILGRIRDQKKIDFFTNIDLFVLPSITVPGDMDGIPVVLMEAISYAKPIISTNVSGIPEICINDQVGKLIEEKDAEAIVEAIEAISKDKNFANELSSNSLNLAMSEYDLEKNSMKKLQMMEWV